MIAQEQFDQLTAQMLTDRNLCARILGALESTNPTYVRGLYKTRFQAIFRRRQAPAKQRTKHEI